MPAVIADHGSVWPQGGWATRCPVADGDGACQEYLPVPAKLLQRLGEDAQLGVAEVDLASDVSNWHVPRPHYGDEKLRGTLRQTGREANTIVSDALRETVNRLCRHAETKCQDLLVLMDAFTGKTRQKLVEQMYAHIYTRDPVEMKRIIEASLHIESKLNSGIQFADWICALVTRVSHFQLVGGSAFDWASQHFRASLADNFTWESKLHLLHRSEIHHRDLFKSTSSRHTPMHPATIGGRIPNHREIYAAAQRRKARTR
ncbi:DUF3800 domain-containing protein [Oerskovia paurometabola]|uniref:DUF3800 domain-containing protein n=1 Tax=Oerskovia paurometabola TaxID=162170 RepID=UPI00381A0445